MKNHTSEKTTLKSEDVKTRTENKNKCCDNKCCKSGNGESAEKKGCCR